MTESSKGLARLEPVDLRKVWPNEAEDFTPWLARPENLRLLGETLGMELDDVRTEQSVGTYSADMVATNTTGNRRVVIENQLERTDHDHLGKILTYAAGLDALTVVWMAERFTERHRAALAWLNRISDTNIRFFGIEIEIWRIDGSRCAPKFNLVAKPNEWTKTLPSKTKQTPLQQAQFDFWTGFRDYATEHARRIKPTAPQPQNWNDMSIGKTGFRLNAVAPALGWDSGEPEIRAEFVMYRKVAQQDFETLRNQREAIDAEFPDKPEWYSEEGVLQRKIFFRKSVGWRNPDEQEGCYRWLVERLDRLHEVFQPRILQLP